ncbi:MAG: chromosome segregation protein ParM [Alphaproteobacteria bacterium]|nr:MAG: chromosome segregation protein ParM [Alphaproteobacteria bacterium]
MRKARWHILLVTGAATAAAAIAFALPAANDRLLYNHTPSVPVGLYLRTEAPIARGAFVTVRAQDVAPDAARARGFDGARNRFIKRVAALAGDQVCAEADVMTINGSAEVVRSARDSRGAPLERWSGCRVLEEHEVLLLGDAEQSFDGRYWGPIDRNQIEGVWRPL